MVGRVGANALVGSELSRITGGSRRISVSLMGFYMCFAIFKLRSRGS